MAQQSVKTITVDGVDVFYRYAGPQDAPAILLLHGFPSSSHQFRHLLPLLAKKYRVYAPDLPGYGFTNVPAERKYTYTFENIANTIDAFVDSLKLKRYAIYIFDYGAPTGLRLALKHPDAVTAIITQNGNAYEEGFGADFWAPLRSYWKTDSPEERKAIEDKVLTLETTKWQYEFGSSNPRAIQPETYYLDQALFDRPGNHDIQLDLLRDYATNIPLYPEFQKYFRDSKVPVLAIWGKNDVIFVPPGAEAFARDARVFELYLIDEGHFAIENNESFFVEKIHAFLEKNAKA